MERAVASRDRGWIYKHAGLALFSEDIIMAQQNNNSFPPRDNSQSLPSLTTKVPAVPKTTPKRPSKQPKGRSAIPAPPALTPAQQPAIQQQMSRALSDREKQLRTQARDAGLDTPQGRSLQQQAMQAATQQKTFNAPTLAAAVAAGFFPTGSSTIQQDTYQRIRRRLDFDLSAEDHDITQKQLEEHHNHLLQSQQQQQRQDSSSSVPSSSTTGASIRPGQLEQQYAEFIRRQPQSFFTKTVNPDGMQSPRPNTPTTPTTPTTPASFSSDVSVLANGPLPAQSFATPKTPRGAKYPLIPTAGAVSPAPPLTVTVRPSTTGIAARPPLTPTASVASGSRPGTPTATMFPVVSIVAQQPGGIGAGPLSAGLAPPKPAGVGMDLDGGGSGGGGKLTAKRKIQELVGQIDPNERLEPEVEDVSVMVICLFYCY